MEIGFNQPELLVTEGDPAAAAVCAGVTSGNVERNVTLYLETFTLTGSGMLTKFVVVEG